MKKIAIGYRDLELYPSDKMLRVTLCGGKSGIFTTELDSETVQALSMLFDGYKYMQSNKNALREALGKFL